MLAPAYGAVYADISSAQARVKIHKLQGHACRLPLPHHATCGCLQVLAGLFSGIVPDALQLVRKQLKETVPTCNHNLVASCFNLMDSLVKPYLGQEGGCSTHSNQILRCCLCNP